MTARIVADAEKKISKSGKEYLSFRVANNEYSDRKDENGKQKTYWYSVISFNHINMVKYLTKGKPIIVVGDVSDRIYQNNQGVCDISREIMASGIYFIDNGNKQNSTESSSPTVQTTMETSHKPSTAELNIPTESVATTTAADEDDLPF